MKKKIIIVTAFTAIVAGSVVAYAKGSTVTNDTYQIAPTASLAPAAPTPAPKAIHPLDRGGLAAAAGIKNGPNRPLMVVEDDLISQIKKMNASGEYMNEVALVAYLHAMTHQKIKSSDIIFSVKMTPEMIDLMIENTKNTKDLTDQKRADFLAIVENWKAGDFSQVDKDHNYFWTLQGGTIGKATGINSAAEEAAFVTSHFKDGKMTSSQ